MKGEMEEDREGKRGKEEIEGESEKRGRGRVEGRE